MLKNVIALIEQFTKTAKPALPVVFAQGSARRGVKSIVQTNDLSGEKVKAAGQMALGRDIASVQTTLYR